MDKIETQESITDIFKRSKDRIKTVKGMKIDPDLKKDLISGLKCFAINRAETIAYENGFVYDIDSGLIDQE